MAQLGRRVATAFTHQQTTAATTWTIDHNLKDYPLVDVFISVNGTLTKIIPSSLVYVDIDVCQVNFTEPQVGYATVL